MNKYNITVKYDYTSRDTDWFTIEAENEEEAIEKVERHLKENLDSTEKISNIEIERIEKKPPIRYYYVCQSIGICGMKQYIDFYVSRTSDISDGLFKTRVNHEMEKRKDMLCKKQNILKYSSGKLEIEEVTLEEYMCGRSCTL